MDLKASSSSSKAWDLISLVSLLPSPAPIGRPAARRRRPAAVRQSTRRSCPCHRKSPLLPPSVDPRSARHRLPHRPHCRKAASAHLAAIVSRRIPSSPPSAPPLPQSDLPLPRIVRRILHERSQQRRAGLSPPEASRRPATPVRHGRPPVARRSSRAGDIPHGSLSPSPGQPVPVPPPPNFPCPSPPSLHVPSSTKLRAVPCHSLPQRAAPSPRTTTRLHTQAILALRSVPRFMPVQVKICYSKIHACRSEIRAEPKPSSTLLQYPC